MRILIKYAIIFLQVYFVQGTVYMRCENVFCIYWVNNNCGLDEISLDIQGNCQDCIYVDIKEEELENHRQKLLRKYSEI